MEAPQTPNPEPVPQKKPYSVVEKSYRADQANITRGIKIKLLTLNNSSDTLDKQEGYLDEELDPTEIKIIGKGCQKASVVHIDYRPEDRLPLNKEQTINRLLTQKIITSEVAEILKEQLDEKFFPIQLFATQPILTGNTSYMIIVEKPPYSLGDKEPYKALVWKSKSPPKE